MICTFEMDSDFQMIVAELQRLEMAVEEAEKEFSSATFRLDTTTKDLAFARNLNRDAKDALAQHILDGLKP